MHGRTGLFASGATPILVDGGSVFPSLAVCRLIGGVSLNHHNCGLGLASCVVVRSTFYACFTIRMCDNPRYFPEVVSKCA